MLQVYMSIKKKKKGEGTTAEQISLSIYSLGATEKEPNSQTRLAPEALAPQTH